MATRVCAVGPRKAWAARRSAGAEPVPVRLALPCQAADVRELRVALALLEFVSVGDEHLAAELLRHFVLETRHLASLLRRGRWLASTSTARPLSTLHTIQYHTVLRFHPPLCPKPRGGHPLARTRGGCTDRSVHCGPASYIKLA